MLHIKFNQKNYDMISFKLQDSVESYRTIHCTVNLNNKQHQLTIIPMQNRILFAIDELTLGGNRIYSYLYRKPKNGKDLKNIVKTFTMNKKIIIGDTVHLEYDETVENIIATIEPD